MSGYSATGSDRCAMAPAMINKTDSTAAKTGRSMKKWEMRMALLLETGLLCSSVQGRGDRHLLHLDLHAGADERVCDAFDHDQVVAGEAVEHHAQVLVNRTRHDGPLSDRVVLIDDKDDLLVLIREDGLVGNEQRIHVAAEEAKPSECARN